MILCVFRVPSLRVYPVCWSKGYNLLPKFESSFDTSEDDSKITFYGLFNSYFTNSSRISADSYRSHTTRVSRIT